MTISLLEQVDKTGNNITYSWLLEGVLYRQRRQLLGWKWIKGYRSKGSFVTNDLAIAARIAKVNNLAVKSNGTHKLHNIPFRPELNNNQIVKDIRALPEATVADLFKVSEVKDLVARWSDHVCHVCPVKLTTWQEAFDWYMAIL